MKIKVFILEKQSQSLYIILFTLKVMNILEPNNLCYTYIVWLKQPPSISEFTTTKATTSKATKTAICFLTRLLFWLVSYNLLNLPFSKRHTTAASPIARPSLSSCTARTPRSLEHRSLLYAKQRSSGQLPFCRSLYDSVPANQLFCSVNIDGKL